MAPRLRTFCRGPPPSVPSPHRGGPSRSETFATCGTHGMTPTEIRGSDPKRGTDARIAATNPNTLTPPPFAIQQPISDSRYRDIPQFPPCQRQARGKQTLQPRLGQTRATRQHRQVLHPSTQASRETLQCIATYLDLVISLRGLHPAKRLLLLQLELQQRHVPNCMQAPLTVSDPPVSSSLTHPACYVYRLCSKTPSHLRVTRQCARHSAMELEPCRDSGRHPNTDQDRGCQQHEYGMLPFLYQIWDSSSVLRAHQIAESLQSPLSCGITISMNSFTVLCVP